MRRTLLLTVLLVPVMSLCSAETSVGKQKALVLVLEVTSGTANGHPVAGNDVTVEIYQHNNLLRTLQGKVGAGGRAIFENVPSGEHMVAVAKVFHDSMSFGSNSIRLEPGQNQVDAHVQVFDVSYDSSPLLAKTHHFIIKRQDSSILVTEYIQLVNPSDLAISSDNRDSSGKAIVLSVSLPRGFKDFRSHKYFVPEALRFTKEGFYDTMGVPPGNHEILFTYAIDRGSDGMAVTKKLSVPTAHFVLFSELGRGKLKGLGGPGGNMVLSDGASAEYYEVNDLAAGAEIAFKIDERGTGVEGKSPWVLLAVVFVAITVLAVSRLLFAKEQRGNHAGSS